MPSEKDYNTIETATLYKLRLIFSQSEKETYTKQDILELLDQIATAKQQD